MIQRPTLVTFISALLLLAPSVSRLLAQTPGVPATLTIDQAVTIALDRNPSVTLAASQVRSSSARVNGAFGAFLPQINFFGGYSKQLDANSTVVIQGVQIPTNRPDYSYNAGASATLTLFDGFGNSASYSSARTDLESSMQTLDRTRQDITHQVRTAYLNALRTDQIIEIRNSDLDVARERLAQNKERVTAGAGLQTAVYAQESEVANAELSLEQARTDAVVAHNALSQLLNYDPAVNIELSSEGLANSVDSSQMIADRARLGTMQEMLDRQASTRRDIMAARLNVESASSKVTAARATYWPSISTSLQWNWQKAGPSDPSAATTFGLNLQYAAFDGFRTSEQVQLAEAQQQSAELELQKLQIAARGDLEQALARLDGARRQVLAADRAVAAARQNRFSADELYKAGSGNYIDYLLANSQYLTAQVNQVNAVFNYRQALYDVQYNVGE